MDGKETNDPENETRYATVEDQLSMYRTASNETAPISEIPKYN